MHHVSDEIIRCFAHACHQAADFGLMRCSSGNLSIRVDADHLLVKASRSWLANVTADDVSLCRIADGELIEGRKPSVEIGFHAGILRERPEVNVVMHFQTPYATTLACRNPEPISYNVIPEIPFYVGPVARIPYLPPGSKELAQAVIDAMRSHDMVVMGNHGEVTVACDVEHAIQNALFFELACEILLHAGDGVVPIPEAEAQKLLDARRSANAPI